MGSLSHENYRGYDAIIGKVQDLGIDIRVKTELLENIGRPLVLKDLPAKCPENWLSRLNAVREWAQYHDMRFSMSPFDYQLAKVFGDGFTIVLWQSKMKKSRAAFIKPAFEGVGRGPQSGMAMNKISALVRG